MIEIPSDKKIGLALGGGAVLGAAHIGVLKALEELNINVSYLTGTSIGALIGSIYAFHGDYSAAKDVVIDLTWRDISSLSLSKFGLFSNQKMHDFVQETIGDVTFEESDIPMAFVATNITTGKKVVLNQGKVAEAVMASSCIPGVFHPVEINDTLLVDGGIVENVPISPLQEMGADYIIAIDLNTNHTYQQPKNLIDVLLNTFHFTLSNATKLQIENADVLIQPDLSDFSRVDVKHAEDLIKAGYNETLKAFGKLG